MPGDELLEWVEKRCAGEDLFVADPPAHHVKTVRDAMSAMEAAVLARTPAVPPGPCGLDDLLALRTASSREDTGRRP